MSAPVCPGQELVPDVSKPPKKFAKKNLLACGGRRHNPRAMHEQQRREYCKGVALRAWLGLGDGFRNQLVECDAEHDARRRAHRSRFHWGEIVSLGIIFSKLSSSVWCPL